jgi:hypothetical protein
MLSRCSWQNFMQTHLHIGNSKADTCMAMVTTYHWGLVGGGGGSDCENSGGLGDHGGFGLRKSETSAEFILASP